MTLYYIISRLRLLHSQCMPIVRLYSVPPCSSTLVHFHLHSFLFVRCTILVCLSVCVRGTMYSIECVRELHSFNGNRLGCIVYEIHWRIFFTEASYTILKLQHVSMHCACNVRVANSLALFFYCYPVWIFSLNSLWLCTIFWIAIFLHQWMQWHSHWYVPALKNSMYWQKCTHIEKEWNGWQF